MQMIVAMKLTDPRIVPNPASASPNTHRSPPMPGEYTSLDSGAYANHPKLAAPPGVRKPAVAMVPPNRYSQ
jgi:hypothetical protein